MAAVYVFRAAWILSTRGTRWITTTAPVSVPVSVERFSHLRDRLYDPGESDGELSDALSDAVGYASLVATFDEPFELRKMQVRWGRNSEAAAGTDDAVTTHHFLKLSGGSPVATWDAADFAAVETAFATFWDAIKGQFHQHTVYKQARWYKAGPDIAPPQPPVRIIDPNVAATGSIGNGTMPPQVALSVTEKTGDPKSWGRFYLPAPSVVAAKSNGRVGSTIQTAVADAADAFYEACVTAGVPGVVYSSAKPSRPTAGGGTLPARDARALTVTQVQVDDLYDVIRSRRFNEPLLRLQRDIAGA